MNIEYIVSPEYAVKKVKELLLMRRAYLRYKKIGDEEHVLDDYERRKLLKLLRSDYEKQSTAKRDADPRLMEPRA